MKTIIYRKTRARAVKLMVRNKIAPAVIAVALCGGSPPPCYTVRPHHHHYTTKERERLLAMTIWAEARGGGEVGMLAVAHVILNRVHADRDRWGHHIEGVVGKSWHHIYQFSCWSPRDPNYREMFNVEKLPLGHPDRMAWAMAQEIAHIVIQSDASDPTKGATFYYASSMDTPPAWAKTMKHTATWEGHEFFRPWTREERILNTAKMIFLQKKLRDAAATQHMKLVFEVAPQKPHKASHRVTPCKAAPKATKPLKVTKTVAKIDLPKPKVKPKAKEIAKPKPLVLKSKHAPADGRKRSS